jgi:hypothetical protein
LARPKSFAQAREDVATSRGDLAKEVEVLGRESEERHTAVGGRSDDGLCIALEMLKCAAEYLDRRRDIAADDDGLSAESGRVPRRSVKTLAERVTALLDEEDVCVAKRAAPRGAILRRRRYHQARVDVSRRRDPTRREAGEELFTRAASESLLARFALRCAREKKDVARSHSLILRRGFGQDFVTRDSGR